MQQFQKFLYPSASLIFFTSGREGEGILHFSIRFLLFLSFCPIPSIKKFCGTILYPFQVLSESLKRNSDLSQLLINYCFYNYDLIFFAKLVSICLIFNTKMFFFSRILSFILYLIRYVITNTENFIFYPVICTIQKVQEHFVIEDILHCRA